MQEERTNCGNFQYDPEDLLPLVAELIDEYTSKDSTSVTYETAQMLMEAIVYTINQAMEELEESQVGAALFDQKSEMSVRTFYKKGKQVIQRKVLEAKAVYEKLMLLFDAYGCENYRDTIQKGIPEFFKHYDMKFEPQNHILTFDYPLFKENTQLSGIDKLLNYVNYACEETLFLSYFEKEGIQEVLRTTLSEYEALYLDNICEPVLNQAILTMIAQRPVASLALQEDDYITIEDYFEGNTEKQVLYKVNHLAGILTEQMPKVEQKEYFTLSSPYFFSRHLFFQK